MEDFEYELNVNTIGKEKLLEAEKMLHARQESDQQKIESQKLMAAVNNDDIATVQQLIQSGVNKEKSTISNLAPLTEAEVKKLATEWYNLLDVHGSLEDYRPLLAEEGLKMEFPEGTFTGWEGFKSWYERVIGIYFDQVHTLKELKITSVSGNKVEVKIVVNWQASTWNPPAPKSERIVMDAYQTWEVTRSPQTQKPVIQVYIVDSMEYAEGSAKL